MKKKGFALFTALLVAFQFIITQPIVSMNMFTASASSDAVSVADAKISVTALDIEINGAELTANTEVKTGDQLSFKFNWEMPENFTYVNGKFYLDLSDKLYGVSLGNQTITVVDADGEPTAIYTVEGDMLYIQLLKGSSNRSGTCKLSGTINLDKVETGTDGKFDLKIIDQTVAVIAPELIPGLWTAKSAVGTAYFGADGNLYQDFQIKVGSNNAESQSVTFTDTYGSVYTGISDVKVDGTEVTPTVNGSSFTIDLGNIASDSEKVITYTAQLDADTAFTYNDNMWQYADAVTNTVTVSSPSSEDKTSTANYSISYPSVSKSGSYDEATKKITWTIVVYGNIYKDFDFTVADTISHGLTTKGTINKEDFEDNGDGSYTYTYETDAGSLADTVLDIDVVNKAEVTFENVETVYTGTGVVGIEGSLKNFVAKSYVKNGKTITWTVNVEVPADLDITEIEISDVLMANEDYGYGEQCFTNGIISPQDSTVSTDSFKITDGNGNTYKLSDIGAIGVQSVGAHYMNIYIDNANYIESVKGTTLTLTYDTTVEDTALKCSNTATVTFKTPDGTAVDSAKEQYVNDKLLVSKGQVATNYYWSQGKNRLGWAVYVSSAQFAAGETITIVDTLPEGYVLEPSSVHLDAETGEFYMGASNIDEYVSAATSGNVVTFTITISDKVVKALETNGVSTLRVAYTTAATEAEYNNWVLGNTAKDYKNTAVVQYDGTSASCEHTQTLTPESTWTFDKNYDYGQQADTETDKAFYAYYSFKVNHYAAQLNGGSSYVLTDELGTNLTLVPESVMINGWNDTSRFTYDDTTKTLKITLDDSTAYNISYKAKVRQINLNAGDSEAQLNAKFGNTAYIEVGGEHEFEDSAMVDDDTYRSEGDYVFDQTENQITISGTKIWINDGSFTGSPRPDEIKITLVCTKTTPANVVETETTYHTVNPPVDDEGNWTYTLKDLVTKDADGNTYTYEVSEVTVDGYSVSYSDGRTDLTGSGEVDLDITNTFTAITEEVGSLKIIKSWVGDTDAIRPAVTFTLTDSTGEVYEKTLASGSDSITFENLPLYVYSRNSDGSLKRELRSYTLTESTPDGYTSDLSASSFTLTDTVAAGTKLDTPVEKTVTNTFTADDNEIGSLTVNKSWVDESDTSRPESITITLEDDAGNSVTKTLASGETSVTFENLQLYNYSKDADGNLVRTLRMYTLSEGLVAGYTATIPEEFALTDNLLVRAALTTPVEKTIINTIDKVADSTGTGSLQVNKAWAGDTTAIRPDITITLTDETGEINESKILKAGETSVLFENLPLYYYAKDSAGELVPIPRTYTITESTPDGYEATIPAAFQLVADTSATTDSVTQTITNTFTADEKELGSLQVNKVWEGGSDALRPDSITITLTGSDGNEYTEELASNASYVTFADLPLYQYSKGADGSLVRTPIEYTLGEIDVDGYTADIPETFKLTESTTAGTALTTPVEKTITNTFSAGEDEVGDLKVIKNWVSDTSATRPASIVITLKDNNGNTYTKELASNEASVTFEKLPLYKYTVDGSGNLVRTALEYTLTEGDVSGYTATLPEKFKLTDDTTAGTTLTTPVEKTITNAFTAASTEIGSLKVTKEWQNDTSALRPSVITFTLTDELGNSYIRNLSSTSTEVTFDKLPLYKYSINGSGELVRTAMKYTLSEGDIDGYTAAVPEAFTLTRTETAGYVLTTPVEKTITNTFTAEREETGELKVTKEWTNDVEELRPESITFTLTDESGVKYTETLTSGSTSVTFKDLPLYKYSRDASGNLVRTAMKYTLGEDDVDGYTSTVPEPFALTDITESGTVLTTPVEKTVTNEFTLSTEEIGELKVTKVWVDKNSASRPASITITLTDEEGTVYTESLAANAKSVTFENLPLYKYSIEDGSIVREAMMYTLTESDVSGYTATLPDKFALTDDTTAGTVLTSPVEKTITNTADNTSDDGEDDKPTGGSGGGGSGGGGGGGGSSDDDDDDDKPTGGSSDTDDETSETEETDETEESEETSETEESDETSESEETDETTESEETDETSESEEADGEISETVDPDDPNGEDPDGGNGTDGEESVDPEDPENTDEPLDPDDPNNLSQFGDGGTATGANPFTGSSAPAGIVVTIATALTLTYLAGKKRDDIDFK